MDSIYFDFYFSSSYRKGLSQSGQIKRGMREWLAVAVRAHTTRSLNFITITVLRLNQFISDG